MMDHKLPLCFFTKKNGAAIRLVDRQIYSFKFLIDPCVKRVSFC